MLNGATFWSGPSMKPAPYSALKLRKGSDCGRIHPSPGSCPLPKSGKSKPVCGAMQRHQLEHLIRAAPAITGAEQFVIVGSQSVLGQFPNALPAFCFRSSRGDEALIE